MSRNKQTITIDASLWDAITRRAAAEDDARVYCIDEGSLKQLYFQNPSFGYFLMKLVARRLSENVARLERENVT